MGNRAGVLAEGTGMGIWTRLSWAKEWPQEAARAGRVSVPNRGEVWGDRWGERSVDWVQCPREPRKKEDRVVVNSQGKGPERFGRTRVSGGRQSDKNVFDCGRGPEREEVMPFIAGV